MRPDVILTPEQQPLDRFAATREQRAERFKSSTTRAAGLIPTDNIE
jgi:hypothetical protein